MEMTEQRKGVFRRWAKEFGLSIDEYFDLCKTHKRCQKCKEWKPRAEYAKDASRHDSLHVRCNSCHRVKVKKPIVITKAQREALAERSRNNKWRKGIPLSDAQKRKLSELRKAEGENGNGSFYGSNNPNWKGGITPEIHKARTISEYREWRTAVFERDHFACTRCGDNKGGNLHAHHIKKFADFPELRYKVSNGVTLCFDCHAKEHDVPNSYRKRKYARRKKI